MALLHVFINHEPPKERPQRRPLHHSAGKLHSSMQYHRYSPPEQLQTKAGSPSVEVPTIDIGHKQQKLMVPNLAWFVDHVKSAVHCRWRIYKSIPVLRDARAIAKAEPPVPPAMRRSDSPPPPPFPLFSLPELIRRSLLPNNYTNDGYACRSYRFPE